MYLAKSMMAQESFNRFVSARSRLLSGHAAKGWNEAENLRFVTNPSSTVHEGRIYPAFDLLC
tara:strand:- start:29 stop:214 length:186 start_codon:yes stop_codon:yes gene_type:complete